MEGKILIVEDEFLIAGSLRLILEGAGYTVQGIATSVPKALEMIRQERPAWVFLDIYLSGKLTGIDLARNLIELNIPFIYVSANSNQTVLMEARTTKPLGFLVKPFREQDVLVTLEVAKYRHENDLETHLKSETALKNQIVRIFNETIDKQEELTNVIGALAAHIPFNCFLISWKDNYERAIEGRVFTQQEEGKFTMTDLRTLQANYSGQERDLHSLKKSQALYAKTACLTDSRFMQFCKTNPIQQAIAVNLGLQSALVKSFEIAQWGRLTFTLFSHSPQSLKLQHATLLDRLELLLVRISDYFPQIKKLGRLHTQNPANQSAAGNLSVTNTPAVDFSLYGMVGRSPGFQHAKEQLQTVAPFDISVLLLGESGTGKERAAQALHSLSERHTKPFIKVNCAAIPATLIEAELFGHEKGAFTGAHERRIGKFEQANNGTIFLDEIGEVPLDLQVKLLCVLQEKEIVRLGGNQLIKTDVRIIAATNRNLETAIAEGRFRLDLYYRLNVFPITMPPLRQRREDIPALVEHFITTLSDKMRKPPKTIAVNALQTLLDYEWPGNIRELENIIERSLILNRGAIIEHIDLPDVENNNPTPPKLEIKIKTFSELEKEHILTTLEFCKGRISGPGGAAELLDISPSTLTGRLKKLGITKHIS